MIIQNDGPLITATDYWQSEYARAGIVYVSINAGALRLLLPHGGTVAAELLAAATTARECIISRGLYRGRDAYELLYEDDTDSPYSLHITIAEQADRTLPASESGRSVAHTIWTRGFRDAPTLAVSLPGRFRAVMTLPHLKPWPR